MKLESNSEAFQEGGFRLSTTRSEACEALPKTA